MRKLGTHAAICDAEDDVVEAQRAYLKRFGWNETCSMPGAYWLWRRDFADVDKERQAAFDARPVPTPPHPYGIITASTVIAIGMTQSVLDHDEDPEDDDDES
jgi:hypothetical protein